MNHKQLVLLVGKVNCIQLQRLQTPQLDQPVSATECQNVTPTGHALDAEIPLKLLYNFRLPDEIT